MSTPPAGVERHKGEREIDPLTQRAVSATSLAAAVAALNLVPALADGGVVSTGSLNQAGQGHTATLLADGRVLVAGGYAAGAGCCLGPTPSATAAVYDPMTDTWAPGPNLNIARYVGMVTPLGDGRVLVAAGRAPADTTATAELYRP